MQRENLFDDHGRFRAQKAALDMRATLRDAKGVNADNAGAIDAERRNTRRSAPRRLRGREPP